MRYFKSKQIHSTFASFSSGDMFVTQEIDRAEFDAFDGEKVVSRKHGFSVAYTDSDKRFYDVRSLSHASQDELEAYVLKTYLLHGWTVDHPFLKTAQSAHWADEEKATTERRTKAGYVIPEWSRDIPPEAYQGGFSDEIFFHPELFDYVKGGGCHGFIGHSKRQPQIDKHLETQFLETNADKSLLAMWLTSTGGRHFGDELKGKTINQQKSHITASVNRLVEQALRYRREEAA